MNTTNEFKKKVLKRIADEIPSGFPLCMPNFPTENFIGLPEWGRVFIQHASGDKRSQGGTGASKYNRRGTIILRAHLPMGEGDKRADEISKAFQDMFEGRGIEGISSTFLSVNCREAGGDDSGRYNILLCEAVFAYMEIK